MYKRLTDDVMADLVYTKSSYRWLERWYKKHPPAALDLKTPDNDVKANEFVYWTCWFQGMENAPPLVKACHESVRKNAGGHRIIVINYKNLNTYTNLPEWVIEKHSAGLLPQAQFADIIRTYLLYVYGGVWFDATVFFTGTIPQVLLRENLFFFRSPFHDKYCPVSNWFIIAGKKNSPLLYRLLCALCRYWAENDTMIDYFMFHYLLQVLINNDDECRRLFSMIPYHSNQDPHYLQKKLLFHLFDERLWENVKQTSFCHKLTYKIPPDQPLDGTFFEFLTNTSRQ